MFGSIRYGAPFAVLCSLVLAACGGDLDVYNNFESDAGGSGPPSGDDAAGAPGNNGAVDAGVISDAATEPDLDLEPELDAGATEMPDMPVLDMEVPEPTDPTTNVPQQGPTVGAQIAGQCSTAAVKGLSLQLLEQMNCERPGTMKSFDGAAGVTYGASVFPFQQGPATDALLAAAASRAGNIPINSALRTLPQQLLLYEWYNRGLCNANLAASPGRSNHNGGLAIDIGDSGTWRTAMRNRTYVDNVSGEPWHFFYSGAGGVDVRNLSVLAFQKLYNRNFPENRIDEDGAYGPQTEGALKKSPANGFTVPPRCPTVMALSAYPNGAPLEVLWERIAEGLVGIRTVAPTGIRLVEYFIDGELVAFSDLADAGQFESVIELSAGLESGSTIEVIARDSWGEVQGRATGLIDPIAPDALSIFVRPLGGVNYEIGIEELPPGVAAVEYYIDGIPTDQDSNLAVSVDTKRRLATQLEGTRTIDILLLDKRDRVIALETRVFRLGAPPAP